MLVDNLKKYVQALHFIQFREVARKYIEARGFVGPVGTDGWSDGGSDLRVYERGGLQPVRVAIQISVVEKWQPKVREDAVQAQEKLGCSVFVYLSNHRIPDAVFVPIADELFDTKAISVSKHDRDTMAQYLLDADLLTWFVDFADLRLCIPALARSVRQEVTDAFILFSDQASDFRRALIERSLLVAAFRSEGATRDELIANALSSLGMSRTSPVEGHAGAFDRLHQGGLIEKANEGYRLSKEEKHRLEQAQVVREADWGCLVRGVRELLRRYLHKSVPQEKLTDAALRVAKSMGRIVHAYRNYQALILAGGKIDEQTRPKHAKEAASVEAELLQAGVRQPDIRDCFDQLCSLEKAHPILAKLEAGEVYRQLITSDKDALLRALGQASSVRLCLDTSVGIPLLCDKLHGGVREKGVIGSSQVAEAANSHGFQTVLPDVYLEECATHLIVAGRYAPIVASQPLDELHSSENAFVAYFARAEGKRGTYWDYLRTFGYRSEATDFYRHRSIAMGFLAPLFQRYNVYHLGVRGMCTHREVMTGAEVELAHVYKELKEERPEILVRHDVAVLGYLRQQALTETAAQIIVTWDNTLHLACQSQEYNVLSFDPISTAGILNLLSSLGEDCPATELVLSLEQEEVSLASMIWDTIVSIEHDNLTDAQLLEKANAFKEEFLRKQIGDSVRSKQIVAAWNEWKRMTGGS